jgi:hypothetical protein
MPSSPPPPVGALTALYVACERLDRSIAALTRLRSSGLPSPQRIDERLDETTTKLHRARTSLEVEIRHAEDRILEQEIYLGDGVYAAFKEGQIRICGPHADHDSVVFLEPLVFAALVDFGKRCLSNLTVEGASL